MPTWEEVKKQRRKARIRAGGESEHLRLLPGQQPQGPTAQVNAKCPHCEQIFKITIVLTNASFVVGVPRVDRTGAMKFD